MGRMPRLSVSPVNEACMTANFRKARLVPSILRALLSVVSSASGHFWLVHSRKLAAASPPGLWFAGPGW
jgi:hypothetical protein